MTCNAMLETTTMGRYMKILLIVTCNYQHLYSHHRSNDLFIDYLGEDVSLSTFLNLLLGNLPSSLSSKRKLYSNENSTLLLFLNGHGGDDFFKFRVYSFDIFNPRKEKSWIVIFCGMYCLRCLKWRDTVKWWSWLTLVKHHPLFLRTFLLILHFLQVVVLERRVTVMVSIIMYLLSPFDH